MIFQWHITENCNLKCLHCYQEEKEHDLKFEKLLYILEEMKNFVKSRNTRCHINITGGEPLLRKDFFDLIKIMSEEKFIRGFGVLTNGTLIGEEEAKLLKKASFVQVSIDGNEETHNKIRGKGNLERVLKGIKILKKNKIRSYVSFTASKENYKEFPEVCKISKKYKVDKVWSDRLIPTGNGKNMEVMTKEETEDFFEIMRQERIKKTLFSKTKIHMGRSLQFLKGGDLHQCSAGLSLITIMPEGSIYPCRRMPINCGNIFEKSLSEVYEERIFKELRSDKNIEGCEKCIYLKVCKGGLRCLSYSLYNNSFIKDPGCFLK